MSGGPEQQRDSRSMASPRQSAAGEGRSRTPAARDPGAPPPLSVPRRLGVLAVVGALAGSILLAVGSGTPRPTAPGSTRQPSPPPSPGASSDAPGPTASPLPVGAPPRVTPVVTPPETSLLATREAAFSVTIPDPGVPLRTLELRVYRNERQVMDGIRVRDLAMVVRKVPLRRGENRIQVALANAGGEGPRSEPVVVTVDDQAPSIDVREPADGAVVNGSLVTIRGVTEPGLALMVRNASVGAVQEVAADEQGLFITEMRLGPDENRFEIETQDTLGNRTRQVLTVVRGDAVAAANLSINPSDLRLTQLPTSVNVRLQLIGADRKPVASAPVTFTLSPPGLATEVYDTVTDRDGIARWDDVVIARDGASKGNGFVTVRAELGDGIAPATATKPFTIK